MALADGFSRLPNKRVKEAIDLDFIQFSAQKLALIQLTTNADPTMCKLRNMILRSWLDAFKEVDKNMRPYWVHRNELAIENGIFLKGEWIIIPKSMQEVSKLFFWMMEVCVDGTSFAFTGGSG